MHAAVIVTEWEEFRELDLERVASLMHKPPLLVDGRNALDLKWSGPQASVTRGSGVAKYIFSADSRIVRRTSRAFLRMFGE